MVACVLVTVVSFLTVIADLTAGLTSPLAKGFFSVSFDAAGVGILGLANSLVEAVVGLELEMLVSGLAALK